MTHGNGSELDVAEIYAARLPVLQEVALVLDELLRELFVNRPRIDRIVTRVKRIDRFDEKARRRGPDGEIRYLNPLEDIQDQIGARIIVYYQSDISPSVRLLLDEVREIENVRMVPDSPEQFGYEAQHVVCLVPPDVVARYHSPISFFEVQVSTLFQHAWAEANHDLGYKPQEDLSNDERRRLAWASAQAWGSDQVFDDLWVRRSTTGTDGWRVIRERSL